MVEQNGQCLCRRARSRHCRRRRATAVRVLGMRCCHQRVVEYGSGGGRWRRCWRVCVRLDFAAATHSQPFWCCLSLCPCLCMCEYGYCGEPRVCAVFVDIS